MSLRLSQVRLPLSGFELQIDAAFEHSITGIFGPSGAGKTSLLELIAGLRRPVAGTVQLGDVVLVDDASRRNIPPRLRQIGYVPQDLALFPHLNVRANLSYGARPGSSGDGLFTLAHVIETMEIAPLLERNLSTLSGGELQRVAFGRALLSAPRLLLLDEPMSSLDKRLKERLMPLLRRIRDEFRIPLIYVTHDASELLSLCEEVLILEQGRLTGRGSPGDVLAGF